LVKINSSYHYKYVNESLTSKHHFIGKIIIHLQNDLSFSVHLRW